MTEPLPKKLPWWVANRSLPFTIVALVVWSALGAVWITNLVINPWWGTIGTVVVWAIALPIWVATLVYLVKQRAAREPTADRWHEE